MAVRINQIWLGGLVCLPFLAGVVAPGHAAPILGQNQEEQIAEPTPTPVIQPTGLIARPTVIHFSILPSPANPDRLETTIFVQQDGGRRICVNHTSPAIVVRGYQTDADPFTPDLPSRVEGQESGDKGELAGFNSKNVFIRPRGSQDHFDLPDEPFSVGQFEGVFRRDEIECDQELTEGDYACLDEVIRTSNCDLSQHASLVRDLRIAIVLNSTQITAPAAGGAFTGQDFGLDSGTSTPPSNPTGAAPLFSGSFGGSGGDGLLLIPNLVGLPLPNALSVIVTSGFVLGSVEQKSSKTASSLKGFVISTAHAQGVSGGTVISQNPIGGTREQPGKEIDLIVQGGVGNPIAVPEPSSFSIFILGILIIAGAYWYFRRRPRHRLTQS